MKTTKRDWHHASGNNKEQSNYIPPEVVKEASYGRWQKEILPNFGIAQEFLIIGKNCPCPACGGHDRYRFEDRNKKTGLLDGSYFCSHCGPGDGINLVAKLHYGGDNRLAFKAISAYLGTNNHSLSQLQVSQLSYRAKEAKAKAVAKQKEELKERLKKREEVAKHAKAIIDNCTMQSNHPYLESKKLHYQVLVNNKNYVINYKKLNPVTGKDEDRKQLIKSGYLIVPLYDVNSPDKLLSVQFIYFNEEKQKWDKRPIAGTQVSDCICVIKDENTKPYCQIVEGWATGVSASISTGFTTIMAIDANGMVSKAEKIKSLYPDKQMVFLADNDIRKGHRRGEEAAHNASIKVNGVVVVPIEAGDWDDYRRNHGIEATRNAINRQISAVSVTFSRVNIADNVIGIDINHPVKLKDGTRIPLRDAMLNVGRYIYCPLSGGEARINAGNIYSITERKIIVPILTALHDTIIINECMALKTTKERVRWAIQHNTKQHVYALAHILRDRFGSSLSVLGSFERLLQHKIEIASEIKDYISHLFDSKVKQGAELCKLDAKQFKKNHRHLEHVNGRIDWEPIASEIRVSNQKVFTISALQGSGKTEDLSKRLVGLFQNVVYITHRQKLVAQATDKLKLFHYKDDKNTIRTIGHVPQFACCTPSLNKDINLNHIRQANLIILDEFIQWFGDLLTNDKCIKPEFDLQARLQTAMKEALLNGCKFVLLDADLTNKGIHQFKRFLGVQLDDVLLIEVQEQQRNLTADISFSTAPRHYQTYGVKLMADDLANNIPFLVAMESANSAQAMFDKVLSLKPEGHAVLLIGGKCLVHKDGVTTYRKTTDFIDNINQKLSDVDALIYTNLVGTGVSITDANKRFTKCYGFFSGWICSAMDAIQMIKRGRDVTEYVLCVLDRPHDYMSSFYRDIGAEAWSKLIDENNDIDTLTYEVKHNKRQNSALFGSCLIGLLRNKHGMTMNHQLSIEDKIENLVSNGNVREGVQTALMSAIPHPDLKHAQIRQMDEYNDDEERFSCEASICLDYFKTRTVTTAAAEIWCNPAKREASYRLESIVKLERSDPDLIIKGAEKRREILIDSGITLDLLNNQRLTQEDIKSLRDSIDRNRGALFGMGLLPERYSKKIPSKSPIKPVSKILEYIGLDTKTIRTGETGTEYELDISVPSPMVSRLGLAVRLSKEEERQTLKGKVLSMHSDGKSDGEIAKELGLKDRYKVMRIRKKS